MRWQLGVLMILADIVLAHLASEGSERDIKRIGCFGLIPSEGSQGDQYAMFLHAFESILFQALGELTVSD